MDFKVVWSEPALDDLKSITAHIAQDNRDAAERTGLEIIRHVELLSSFPFLGPVYPRGSGGVVREVVCRPYRIFYRVIETARQVEVLTIWHGARGEPGISGSG